MRVDLLLPVRVSSFYRWSRSWANPRTPPPQSGLRFAGGFIPGMDMLNHRPGGPSLVWGPHSDQDGTWYGLQAKEYVIYALMFCRVC